MGRRFDTVSFLSDYGHADEFVGVVHSVIRTIAPHAVVVDLVHDLPPYDVRAGSLALSRAVQYVAPGIVLAIVDPGVGTSRRAIAVEVGDDGEGVLIGPDNGLLAPAAQLCGGATRAVELTNPEYQLEAPGPTFGGRDVFAPAAAHLATGVPLVELGDEIDPFGLCPSLIPLSRADGGAIVAEVLWVDRFGNCQLNVDPQDVAPLGDVVGVRAGEEPRRSARRVDVYGDLSTGQLGLLVDSYGLVAIAADRTSAAEMLGIQAGSEVRLEPLD